MQWRASRVQMEICDLREENGVGSLSSVPNLAKAKWPCYVGFNVANATSIWSMPGVARGTDRTGSRGQRAEMRG